MTLRRAHLLFGLFVLAVFLLTGAWLQREGMEDTELAQRLFYRSRHVYLLASSLPHLLLGTLPAQSRSGLARVLQRIGAGLLFAVPFVLFAAFVKEPQELTPETPLASLGILGLLAGTSLSAMSAWMAARGEERR